MSQQLPDAIKILEARKETLKINANSEQKHRTNFGASFAFGHQSAALHATLIEIELVERMIGYIKENGMSACKEYLLSHLLNKAMLLLKSTPFENLAYQLQILAASTVYMLLYDEPSQPSEPTFNSVICQMSLPRLKNSLTTIEFLPSGKIIAIATNYFELQEEEGLFPENFEEDHGLLANSVGEKFEVIEDEMIGGCAKLGHIPNNFLLQKILKSTELRTNPLSRLWDLQSVHSSIQRLGELTGLQQG
jgi:hypothetical protein